MVNLLIVSHSAQLAAGVKEFTDQVTGGKIKIVAAGGTADGALGTSVERIQASLKEVISSDGVLVLVDLGSAVMSVETVLEGEGIDASRVIISDAPLVEGAFLAAVEASTGASLEETAAAALEAREMIKIQH